MTDTVTRCAMAGREVGLSIGAPQTMKGYPPSIFSWLQRALERTGNSERGSITALYTVLMEGDDITDPIVDIVRGIVDGHIFLSRKVAEMNHYPAIDVLGSVSRLFTTITDKEHQEEAGKMRQLMALYRENKDLIDVCMYQMGSNPKLDIAIKMMPQINAFLQQKASEKVTMEGTIKQLKDALAAQMQINMAQEDQLASLPDAITCLSDDFVLEHKVIHLSSNSKTLTVGLVNP